jgi:hypothetical protein
MNTDEEGMDTDGSICFAKQLNHPCTSVSIIFKPCGLAGVTTFARLRLRRQNQDLH